MATTQLPILDQTSESTAKADDQIRVWASGSTTLSMREIPIEQRWFWTSLDALSSFMRAYTDAKNGRVKSLGSFAQYLDADDSE